MYYTTAIAIELSVLLAIITISWIAFSPDSFEANLYLLKMKTIAVPFTLLIIIALGSNFLPLFASVIKNRHYKELPYVFISSWLYWSLIHTYFWANIKGFLGIKSDWFKTPKIACVKRKDETKMKWRLVALNVITLFLFIYVYTVEWFLFGNIDPYAFFWIPAMTVGVFVI